MCESGRVMTTRPPCDEALRPALEVLAARDDDLASAFSACGVPPVRHQEPGFAGLMRIIAAQQVSAASARAIIDRLRLAATPLTPEAFLGLDAAALRAIGLSRQKMSYGMALAEDLVAGRLDLDAAATMDDEAAIAHLVRAKGIGRWSAEIYLLFALGRRDIWPADDLAIRKALQRLKRLPSMPTREELRASGEPWRPHRSAAARFLWHYYKHPGVPGE